MGLFLKYFREGLFFMLFACMHQANRQCDEFALREGIATGNDDLAMHGEPPVKLASSTT